MLLNKTILGFNLTLGTEHTLTAVPYPINTEVSQYEDVYLEAFINGDTIAASVDGTFELPNGKIINHIYFKPVDDQPNKYRIRLNEILGEELQIGEVNNVRVSFRVNTQTSYYNSTAITKGFKS